MKPTNKQKKELQDIFDKNPNLKEVFINDKGEYFTSRNRAELSTEKKGDLIEVKRFSILSKKVEDGDEGTSGTPARLEIECVDGKTLTFPELSEGEEPTVGDKAKEGRKNADGTYPVSPDLSYVFGKGKLEEIVESEND